MAQIGVCSWSLRPHNPDDLVRKVREGGLNAVQIALDPIRRGDWDEDHVRNVLSRNQIAVLSGMMAMRGEDYSTLESIRQTGGVRLDQFWPDNLAAASANAQLARRLGIDLVTFHVGFLPHDSSDPLRGLMLERLRRIAGSFAAEGVAVALETGQESAATLLDVLREVDHPSISVNFDPANMILYGMGDPVQAFTALANWVRQIHLKDAIATRTPGTWGTEVPVGRGDVDWPTFLKSVGERTPAANLVIERESGTVDAIADIRAAHEYVGALLRKHEKAPA